MLLSELSSRQAKRDVLKEASWHVESCPLHEACPWKIELSDLNEEILGAPQSPVRAAIRSKELLMLC